MVATTSALLAKPLADLLLRVVKPAVKKVLKKVATLRGKKIPPQSVSEKIAEQRQRNHAVKALEVGSTAEEIGGIVCACGAIVFLFITTTSAHTFAYGLLG